MRSLSWFIIYRRCARCPGSIKIFTVGYLRYFHGNLRAPTSSLWQGWFWSKDPWKPKKYGLNQLMHLPTQNCKQFYPGPAMARFFFKVASCRSTVNPRFTAHISHKLKHQRCFWFMAEKASFHRHGAWEIPAFPNWFLTEKMPRDIFSSQHLQHWRHVFPEDCKEPIYFPLSCGVCPGHLGICSFP